MNSSGAPLKVSSGIIFIFIYYNYLHFPALVSFFMLRHYPNPLKYSITKANDSKSSFGDGTIFFKI